MSHRAWNYWMVATFLIGGLSVVAFNYLVDPYEVFGHQYLRSGYAINERFRKVEHLMRDDVHHDAYILGSSTMGVFDPDTASRMTGHSFYNLSFLAGTPQEAFDTLRALKRSGKPIKEVLIGIDFFTFYERPQGNAPTFRAHPLVSGESRASFFGYYLFSAGLWQGGVRVAHHLNDSPSIQFDVDGSGMYHLHDFDRARIEDPVKYSAAHFQPNSLSGTEVRWIDDRFVEFEDLCRWLDENKIEAKLFIHPYYGDALATISDKSYREFKNRLLQIRPDVVDFSVARGITQEQSWYYDKRHYRGAVADMIMANVF